MWNVSVCRLLIKIPKSGATSPTTTRRIRRVKCDEARPDCKSCVATGRICDGYNSSLNINSNKTSHRTLLPASTTLLPIAICRPPTTLAFNTVSEDRISFQYFTTHIVSGLRLIFSNHEWITLSLQLSSTEPCIYFAIAACGSVASARLARKYSCFFAPPSSVKEKRNLRQYCKASAALQKYIDLASCGMKTIEPILLCCLLFVAYETYQDENALAVQHMKFGRRAIGESVAGNSGFSSKQAEKDVLAAFNWLGAQALDFGGEGSERREKFTQPFATPSMLDLEYAKQALDSLVAASSNWRSELLALAAEHVATLDISIQRPAILECIIHCISRSLPLSTGHFLLQRQSQLLIAHRAWSQQLASLQKERSHTHRRALLHLQIQLFYSFFILSTARDTHANHTDLFNDQASIVLDLMEEYLSPYPARHGPRAYSASNQGVYPYTPLPQRQESCFSLEYAIVPTLLAICFKLRHSKIRKRALQLLQSANRREAGQWSGELCHYADAIIVLEESVAGTVVPESAKTLEIVIEAAGFLEVGLVCGRFRTEGDGRLEVVEYSGAGLPPLRLQLMKQSVFSFGIDV